MRCCSLIALLLTAAFAITISVAGQQFMCEGRLEYSLERPGLTNEMRRFTVRRDGDRWKITTLCDKSKGTLDLFWEAGSDGTNIFSLDQQDTKQLKESKPPKVFNADNYVTATGRVETRKVPRMDYSMINPLWQAYASASYYSGLTNDKVIPPLFFVEDYSPVLEEHVTWTNGGNRHFISEVTWFSDGSYPLFHPPNKLEIKKFNPPYSEGFVELRFEVQAWTNYSTIVVPSSFSLTKYVPAGHSGAPPKFKAAFRISGSLERIQDVDSFSVIPEISSRALVNDSR